MLKFTVGRGNHRKTFELPSGKIARDLSKTEPIEYTKIKGGIMSLVRNQQVGGSQQ